MFCVAQHSYLPCYGSFNWENSNKFSLGPHIVLLLTGPKSSIVKEDINLTQCDDYSFLQNTNSLFMQAISSGVK